MTDEARERRERTAETRADDGPTDEQSERPRLKEIDHEAPDGTSADGVFDRGTAERTAREQSDARRAERREADDTEADR